jgi:hypothetical protein
VTEPGQASATVTFAVFGAGIATLHASSRLAGQVINGGVRSAIHFTVREVVDVLRHPSVAVNVLVLDLLHPSLTTAPSL